MNKNYEKLQEYIEKSIAMSSALAIFEWDNETLAPESAIDNGNSCKRKSQGTYK